MINISKVMARERAIKSNYPDLLMSYLWFIGVHPQSQNKGIGKILLEEVIEDSRKINRPVYLETSSEKNVSWYLKSGFELYHELDLGYNLFMFRKEFK
ncbi:GNAT family N-acetyltransferase [Dyadobacter subterraneus]|uniref:GNAT family N-acetyltransferase n=1 Tax=Dyadobacter subterraneus TaxID=2773304 RepID=A0ABR9WAI6_9BACT|nr:GNAT family N-acetyltransferase [Dyadobacter subterraneus]